MTGRDEAVVRAAHAHEATWSDAPPISVRARVHRAAPWILLPILVAALAVAATFAMPRSYTATARLLPPQQQGGAAALIAQQLGSLAGLAGAATGIKNPADQFVTLLRSTTIADRLIERFDLRREYDEPTIEDVRRALERNTSISAGAKDGVITVEVDDRDPDRAAKMANAYVEELQRLTSTLAVTEAAQRRRFFETRLGDVSKRLAEAETALRSSGVSETTLRAEPRAAVEGIARLKAALTAAEVRLGTMRGVMTEGNPDYRLALQEASELRRQLERAERGGPGTAGQGGEAYIARYREFKYQETLFELLAKQLELAKLDEGREGPVVQVIDVAGVPERHSWPRRGPIAVLAWVATLVLMIAAVKIVRLLGRRDGAFGL